MSDAVELFTDGACLGNPGPGGWAALLRWGGVEKILAGGEAATTNNRMELMAAIAGLEALKRPCDVRLTTDSRYVQQGIEQWVAKWCANGWRTADKQPVKNQELWQRLAAACAKHHIRWAWVRGHSGHPENERVDQAAREQAEQFRGAVTRKVVLDTETTGLEVESGHRVIEIGCIELIDRRPSGREFHRYLNPERAIDAGAVAVHGITNEFLRDKPRFAEVAEEFMTFIAGAELLIHNAAFDTAFLDSELQRAGGTFGRVADHAAVVDTLALARQKYPGQKNTLDALCKRLGVDNSHREVHGALLDAHLLADVWVAMTAGQGALALGLDGAGVQAEAVRVAAWDASVRPRVLRATEADNAAHAARLAAIGKASGQGSLWNRAEVADEPHLSADAVSS